MFISHLDSAGYAPSSIRTYVSCISHTHRLYNFDAPSSSFVIRKLLDGVQKNSLPRLKLSPISRNLLDRILAVLPSLFTSQFEGVLLRAIMSPAYHLCARVGELTCSQSNTRNVLTVDDVRVVSSNGKVDHMAFTFRHFKHTFNTPHTLLLRPEACAFCPVQVLQQYLTLRGTRPGFLFLDQSGVLVQAAKVAAALNKALTALNVDPSSFNTHSFRVGRATDGAQAGASDAQLRSLGRWHSSAFRSYIRPLVTEANGP